MDRQIDMTKLPIPESYWVEDGLFLAGEYPASYDPETARKRLESFLEVGIRTFINLTQPHELPSYSSILKEQAHIYDYDLAYRRFPIRDHGVPSGLVMTQILDTIDESIQDGKPVYVHCWGGVGRTGVIVGCYLVRHGYSANQAVLRVDELYKTRPHNYFLPSSPETQEQFEFIHNWYEEPSRNTKPRYCEG